MTSSIWLTRTCERIPYALNPMEIPMKCGIEIEVKSINASDTWIYISMFALLRVRMGCTETNQTHEIMVVPFANIRMDVRSKTKTKTDFKTRRLQNKIIT